MAPPLEGYTARDGVRLAFRLYESHLTTTTVLVLLHGSGWHSLQFASLAGALNERGLGAR